MNIGGEKIKKLKNTNAGNRTPVVHKIVTSNVMRYTVTCMSVSVDGVWIPNWTY